MKEIKFENLKKYLLQLKEKEKIFLRINEKSNKMILNKLLYLMIGNRSLENLFKIYLFENNDVINQINVDKIIEKYTKYQLELNKVKENFILNLVGEENYELMCKFELNWSFNLTTNALIINKGCN